MRTVSRCGVQCWAVVVAIMYHVIPKEKLEIKWLVVRSIIRRQEWPVDSSWVLLLTELPLISTRLLSSWSSTRTTISTPPPPSPPPQTSGSSLVNLWFPNTCYLSNHPYSIPRSRVARRYVSEQYFHFSFCPYTCLSTLLYAHSLLHYKPTKCTHFVTITVMFQYIRFPTCFMPRWPIIKDFTVV